jgi:hypothetical protein
MDCPFAPNHREKAMRRLTCCVVLILAAATPVRAQVFVQTPWTNIQVGPPLPARILVQTPWVTVGVGPRRPPVQSTAMPPAEQPIAYVPGAPPPVPLPIPVEAVPAKAISLSEFAATFQPKGGHFEVALEHPATGRPVKVSFTLPDGQPKRVKVHRRDLEFDYGRKQVTIRFLRDGEVRVRD